MKVVKMSISLDPGLSADIRQAAELEGTSLSAWIADAAAARLRSEALDAFFEDYQHEHGAFTDDEIRAAQERLGIDGASS